MTVGALVVATAGARLLAHQSVTSVAAEALSEGESSCAGPRWPVKTLADPAAGSVDLVHVQSGSVAALRELAVSSVGKAAPRVSGTETALVRVTADLVSARVSPDGDLAVVVAVPGSRGQSMTVEFPDPRCLTAATPAAARSGAVAARRTFEQACGRFGTAKTALSGTATLAGVRFIDTPHKLKNGVNARQAAPNEVELHPVLAVTAVSCQVKKGTAASSAGALKAPAMAVTR